MNISAQLNFLSEDSVKLHLSHLSTLRLRLSVLKKSIPSLTGKTHRQIIKMQTRDFAKEEVLPLINSIKSHELYFSSFAQQPSVCKEIREHYSSEAAFLYELYTAAKDKHTGFLYVGLNRVGKPEAVYGDGYTLPSLGFSPRLALDLYEHTYFLDYRFDREKFLRAMLSRLDIGKLFSSDNAQIYLDTQI